MTAFHDLSIRRKLTLISMLVGAASLVAAGVVWGAYTRRTLRESVFRDLGAMADVVGQSSALPLATRNSDLAAERLLTFRSQPNVRAAVLFTPDGTPFATYAREDEQEGFVPPPFRYSARERIDNSLHVYDPVVLRGEVVGVLWLEADARELAERERALVAMLLLVLVGSSGLGLFLAARLQRVISHPILRLASTVRAVSEQADFSLRAEKNGADEVGFLTDSFNRLLDQVQERDAALEHYRAHLEDEVLARTAELRRLNRDLQESTREAQEATVAKSEFLANMSHEIRTPMNGVLGMVDVLMQTELQQEQLRYVRMVKGSGEALLGILNDILDFSKIEAGKLKIEHIPIDLFRMAEEVIELLSDVAKNKGLDFDCQIEPDVPPAVLGDPTRIRQVLANLLNNALKFTEKGRVTLSVERERETERGVVVRFAVHDTGIGIPSDRMGKLFRPFTQVDSSTTREFGGTGLGLAICKQLAELMGGTIGVLSSEGEGSTFWFTVLVQRDEHAATRYQFPEHLHGTPVLLAARPSPEEDGTATRLRAWGFECTTQPTGGKAARALASGGYRVVLAEADLRRGGFQRVVDAAAELDPAPPVIAIVGSQEEGPEGAQASIERPVHVTRLHSVLARVFGVDQERSEEDPFEPAADVSHEARATLRILLAEDNKINQVVVQKLLERAGFTCDVVDDGEKVVRRVAKQRYDVVLMDCQMPRMDGFEATRTIRAEHPAGERPTIVALTANAMKGDRERCLRAGMDDYLSKPVAPRELVAKLDGLVRRREEGPEVAESADAEPESLVSALETAADDGGAESPPTLDSLLDSGVLSRALSGFESRTRACVRALRSGIETRDETATSRAIELLSGAATTLDEAELLALTRELSSSVEAGDFERLQGAVERLPELLDRCFREFGG